MSSGCGSKTACFYFYRRARYIYLGVYIYICLQHDFAILVSHKNLRGAKSKVEAELGGGS